MNTIAQRSNNLPLAFEIRKPGLYPRDNQAPNQDSSSQRERTVPVFPTDKCRESYHSN